MDHRVQQLRHRHGSLLFTDAERSLRISGRASADRRWRRIGSLYYSEEEADAVHIKLLLVEPPYRQRGYAAMLLRMLLWRADRQCVATVLVAGSVRFGTVGPTTPELIRWYRRFGFVSSSRKHMTLMRREAEL